MNKKIKAFTKKATALNTVAPLLISANPEAVIYLVYANAASVSYIISAVGIPAKNVTLRGMTSGFTYVIFELPYNG